MQSPHKDPQQTSVSKSPSAKVAWLSCRFSFSCIEKIHVRRRKNGRSFEPPEVLSASIPGARWCGEHGNNETGAWVAWNAQGHVVSKFLSLRV